MFGADRLLEGDIFALIAIGLGAAAFSSWVFAIVDRQEMEVRRRADQLAALREAALSLTTELDMGHVLQKVVDLSRSLVNARYAALGVLDDAGESIEQFITTGIDPVLRAQMGELPRGHGLLGALIKEGNPIRIPEITDDPRSVGFPPNHPPMHSLLGVPIRSKGRVIGDLYLTDKLIEVEDGTERLGVFTPEDQEVAEMFATQAAIAIENAQLYRKTQQLAILQERQRFGMDLHDGIIQSIYAIGLMLEESDLSVESSPPDAHTSIRHALHGLNDVIRDIRNYILDLRPQRFQGRDLGQGLEEIAREMRANTLLNIDVSTDGVDLRSLSAEQTVDLLHIAQEAITNAAKHARATHVSVALHQNAGKLVLSISDNGQGFEMVQAQGKGGHGLRNMRERAAAIGGELHVDSRVGQGTQLEIQLSPSVN
jgi:two-component system, NarL family, sensor histidine kinase DevS